VGDRAAYLTSALGALDNSAGVHVVRVSNTYETAPVGVTDQAWFLNLAAEIETVLGPLELLDRVKEIEETVGRVARQRWGPREIDIDIILWGSSALDSDRLCLPHAAFRERLFVLAPLAEIAPDAVDPETGLTVSELAVRLRELHPDAQASVLRRGRVEPPRPERP